MPHYHRILWSEGLFLTQHHFQQFDAFQSRERAFQLRTLIPFAWGVSRLVIDVEAVANRLVTVTEFEGIFPDGTTVRAPSVDDPPATRSFETHFGPTERVLSIYVGLPKLRVGAAGVRLEDEQTHSPTRYQRAFANVPDEVTGEHEREIAYTKHRLALLFSGEDIQGYDVLKIAEVERNPDGITQLRESFIPPSLAVSASPWLTAQVRGVLETASAKSESLVDKVRYRTPTTAEVSTEDLTIFLMLQTINAYIPRLAHHYQNPSSHPVTLFELVSMFAGHLCVFFSGQHPRELPAYKHDDLESTFRPLFAKLRELIGQDIRGRCVKIPLTRVDVSRYEGGIEDAQLFTNSDFYLGVSADVPESKLAAEFTKFAKVGSPERLKIMLERNLPGVPMVFVQLPPGAIPRRPNKVYFRIEARDQLWEFVKQKGRIAIYAPPAEFPNWEVECLAVER